MPVSLAVHVSFCGSWRSGLRSMVNCWALSFHVYRDEMLKVYTIGFSGETGLYRVPHTRGRALDRDEELKLLKEGQVEEWNRLRSSRKEIPSLEKADLRYANLHGATLRWATLSKADLSGATLSEADLSGANLSEANPREQANFCGNCQSRPQAARQSIGRVGSTPRKCPCSRVYIVRILGEPGFFADLTPRSAQLPVLSI